MEKQMFLGTKRIHAIPMNRLDYNNFRGWTLPEDENGEDEGYLVEYIDSPNKNTKEFDGYVSWSPKDTFDSEYKADGSMDFGGAIKLMKLGYKVSRSGWNGKGMFIYYVPAAKYPASGNTLGTMKGRYPDDLVPYKEYIAMKTVDDEVVPWTVSQSDALAEDWGIVE